MEEYRSGRMSGGDVYKRDNNGFGIQTPPRPNSNYASQRSTPVQGRFSSSRENSPVVNKSSPENSSMNVDGGQTTKDKLQRRFNLFRRKIKPNDQHNQHQQGQNLCSSGGDSDSSSSVSSSSNSNHVNNNNNFSNRGNLFSTLSRKCSKKFRNLTDRTRNENNAQKSDSQNGSVNVTGKDSGEVSASNMISGGSNEGVNFKRQQKTDGHHSKFDLFSSCRKVPGSPRESLDSISRRVRKDALKARVEAQREQQYRDSSSDDEEQFKERAQCIRRYHSDESLQKRWPGERLSNKGRTERYYRRKVKDDDSSSKGEEVVSTRKDFANHQPTHIRRNLTFGGSRFSPSPCSSPQPRVNLPPYQRTGLPIQNNYCKYEELKSRQATQYSTSGSRTTQRDVREESYIENIVVSGYLPLRKAGNVDGLPRAPTPPLRASGNKAQPRPQSFNFEDANVSNGGHNYRGNGTVATGQLSGPKTVVMSSAENHMRTDSGRPLSFTSTSHVIYNHNVAYQNVDSTSDNKGDYVSIVNENGDRNRISRQSTSPEAPPVAYMSDSQISGRLRSSRAHNYEAVWRKQSQQLNKNFNSVPKPWNSVADENSPVDILGGSARPPPSPSRNSESFTFGVSTNGPLSPKYAIPLQSKTGQLFRNHQQLQSNRKLQSNLMDGALYSDNGRSTLVTSPPLPPTRKYFRQQQSRSSNLESVSHRLSKLVNGNKNKPSDNHLEDALLELEKIYHSMKNDDDEVEEQSLDKGRRNSTCEDLLLHSNTENGNSVNVVIDGLGSYNTLEGRPRSVQGNRNAGVPNKITDDLAYRKIARQSEPNSRPSYMATGSYLLKSPALSPSVSIDDIRTLKNSNSTGNTSNNEPDTILDDLSFRNIRDANLQKIIEPQPPFGIPLGPITNAASSDYMHAQAQDLSRPKMRRRFRPDVVKDDLAYRNLRKNNDKVENPTTVQSPPLNFDELDSILSGEFQQMTSANRKKHRAARSLSANLSQIISQNKLLGSSSSSSSALIKLNNSNEEKSLSASDLRISAQSSQEIVAKNDQNKALLIEMKRDLKPNKEPTNSLTSSSTDTLTELSSTQPPLIPVKQCFNGHNGPSAFRPLSADDKDAIRTPNDIWQVRVTVGSEPGLNDCQQVNEHIVKLDGKPAEKTAGHPLLKPIPLKLEPCRGLANSHHYGNVIGDDFRMKTKGSPIDEVKLDQLLSSLALDTVHPPSIVTCNGQHSISSANKLQGDCKPSTTETFPALVTVDDRGEMSVKILFPNLKSVSAKEKSEETYGNDFEEQGRVENRTFKLAPGPSNGETTDGRNRKEMSSVPARPRSFIANQNVDEKFVGSRIGVRSPLTLKKDIKDGVASNERQVTLKRSGAFHAKSSGSNKICETSSVISNNAMPDNESQPDRIARYKEERRKQLANQYGQWSKRDENSTLGNEPSYMRYSQRSKRGGLDPTTKGSETAKSVSNRSGGGHDEESVNRKSTRADINHKDISNAAKDDIKSVNNESTAKDNERTSSPVDSMVRLNRASRLRAQARANETTTPEFNNRPGSFRNKSSYGANSSKDATSVKSLNRSVTPISSSSEVPVTHVAVNNHPLGNESESGETASDTGKIKDKSAKRKSNLNRMGSVDSTPIPSDSGDDSSRRFRRHRYSYADKSSNCSTDGVQSDSLKSARAVRAFQPQTALPTCPSKSSSKSNSTLEKKEDKHGFKSSYVEDATSESDVDRRSSSRKLKKPTLKRPEIPDIFRSKGFEGIIGNTNCSIQKPSTLNSTTVLSAVDAIPDKRKRPTVKLGEVNDDTVNILKLNKDASSASLSGAFSTSLQTSNLDINNAQRTSYVAQNNELKHSENYKLKASELNVNSFVCSVTKTEDMGARLFKDSPSTEANDDASAAASTVTQSTTNGSLSHKEYDDFRTESTERELYDPSGNWHLAKSSMADIYSFNNHTDDSCKAVNGSTLLSAVSEPVKHEDRTKNRMTVYYEAEDLTNGDAGSSLGETSGWLNSSPVTKKLPSLHYSVTIPVNTYDSSSQGRSVSSEETWPLLESDVKTKQTDIELGGSKPTAIICDGASVSPRKKKTSDEMELPTKSILKSKEDLRIVDGRPPIPHSILKRGSVDEASRSRSPEKCSILKKRGSSEESDHRSDSPEIVSILRRKSTEESEENAPGERQSILRRKSMLDETEHSRSQEFHSILKKQCSLDVMESSHSEPRPILKKKSSSEEIEQSEPRPILKKRSSTEDEYEEKPKPILKTRRRSAQEDLLEVDVLDQVELRRTNRHKTSSPVLRFWPLEDELPAVPNRLSSTSGRHLTTSSEEEFVSVPSSPGSWIARQSVDEEADSTSLQRWERNAAYSLLNGKDGTNTVKDIDNLPFTASSRPVVSSTFDEETVGGETLEKKLSSSSSSSSDSSTEEEEEEEDESEEQSEDEEELEVQPTVASITIGKTESVDNKSVQSSSGHQDDKLRSSLPISQSSTDKTVGSESVHVKSEAATGKPPVVTRHQQSVTSTSVAIKSVQEGKRSEISLASRLSAVQVESNVQQTDKCHVNVVKAQVSKVATINQIESKSDGGDEQDVPRMSVAERASLLMQKMKDQTRPTAAAPPAVTRFANRRGLQRSQTQPVTVGEVNEASKIAEESVKRQRHSAEYEDMEVTPKPESCQENSDATVCEDDPSKLSLADRVKLFNQKMIEERLPTRKQSVTEDDIAGSPPKERPPRRALVSRFKTQPVTSEELEKAQMISNLESKFAKQSETSGALKDKSETLGTPLSNAAVDKPKGILKKKEDVLISQLKSVISGESKGEKGNMITKSMEAKCAGISMSNKTSSTELKSILKMDTFIKHTSGFRNMKDKEEQSSSSSDNDDEDESEGFTINLRSGSSAVISRASTDEDSSSLSQSSASSSSGKQEPGKRIKNEAILRRRNAAIRKQEERKGSEVQLSQNINLSQSFEYTSTALKSVLSGELIRKSQRSSTQPLTQMEKDGALIEVKGGSIAERLAALKASQEEDWKRRLERNKTSEVDGVANSPSVGEDSKMILEKVILLEGSQQEWKRRIEEKDATKFTVAGKMGMGSPPQESPVLDRKKRVPKPIRFTSRTCANLNELAKVSPTSPLPPKSASSITRSKSFGDTKDTLIEEKSLTRVSVPKPDDEGFSSFFESVNLDKLKSQKIEIHDEAFNQLVSESHQFLVQKRSVHVTRRHAGTRNPLKTLAAREDIQQEYTETVTGVAEKELRRLRVEQLAKTSDLATSALAGLASTEDFTSVSLRKSSSVVNASLLPFKDLMLIQVKGRRHVQCRLVEPVVASLNKGDNFILVTPNEVYNWIGEFSNVIERVKGAEFSTIIQSKKDLGYKGNGEVVTFDEEKHSGGRVKRRDFFEHLGGQDEIADPGSPEDDEIYEAAINETNKVYQVEGDELVPYEKYWGSLLRNEMLKNTEVLVFDFGSEMYVWQGKLAPNDLRKKGIQLAQELWDEGYDYSDCDINPISPSRNNLPKYGKKRPPWALFSKVNQHMETVLFRSKFLDWPDLERVIQIKRQESDKSDGYSELQPYDAQLLLDTKPIEPDLVLENCHLGRGTHYWDENERRLCNIATLGVKVWHILEYNHSILPLESWGQFHSGDTYVVRWQYRVAVTGRDLSGKISRHASLGRERCAYFFWQGRHSTINEKGASALMTVELDEERGPHVRVDQGQEPPCFLNLFEGKMICYVGKRGDEEPKADKRLFTVRGDLENEAFLVEVKCAVHSLRESGVFVLVDCKEGVVYMWTGSNVSNHSKDVARFVVENLVQRRPTEMGFKLGMLVNMKEEEQGSESKDFICGIGNTSKNQIQSLMPKIQPATCTPRLFQMTSVSGAFLVHEIVCSYRSTEHVLQYPFLQSELYHAPQPSVFLLDRDNDVYVWQGWWSESSEENDTSGSAHLRWNVERRLALETTVNYCNAKRSENPPVAYTVWAGLEPLEFKHFFPEWDDVNEASERNKMLGRKDGEKKLVDDVLSQLKRTRYPLAELMERPLPEGVDPSIMETYLTDDEFEEVLKTTKEEFYALPSWKQSNIKKSAGLY